MDARQAIVSIYQKDLKTSWSSDVRGEGGTRVPSLRKQYRITRLGISQLPRIDSTSISISSAVSLGIIIEKHRDQLGPPFMSIHAPSANQVPALV